MIIRYISCLKSFLISLVNMENMSSKKVFYQRPRRWRNNSISCLDHSISCLENFILDLKINFEFVGKYEEDVVKQVFIG